MVIVLVGRIRRDFVSSFFCWKFSAFFVLFCARVCVEERVENETTCVCVRLYNVSHIWPHQFINMGCASGTTAEQLHLHCSSHNKDWQQQKASVIISEALPKEQNNTKMLIHFSLLFYVISHQSRPGSLCAGSW
mmetsp:Transcript_26102/g.37835  ORF Transcript_26102/g.37835 Transcript_26102/m.37835 type:complete len:134 (-) Transcript_26102:50-451(-)